MPRPHVGLKLTEQPYLDRVGGKKEAQNCQNFIFLMEQTSRLASCDYL
jgi:hypothetical protein